MPNPGIGLESLLLQHTPDKYAKTRLKVLKLFEFSYKTTLISAVIFIFTAATIVYVFFLKLFWNFNLRRGMVLSLLLVPGEMFIANFSANAMSKGMDLAFAGVGAYFILGAGIVLGLLTGLIVVPMLIGGFCRRKKVIPQ